MAFKTGALLHRNKIRRDGIEMALFSTGFLYISIIIRIENEPNS